MDKRKEKRKCRVAKMERRKVRAAASSFLHRQVFITQGKGHDFYNALRVQRTGLRFQVNS